MSQTVEILLALGIILILGLATDYLGRRTLLPRVTFLLLLGILIGPDMFNLMPAAALENFELIANMTLLMVGFLLGGKLTRKTLAGTGNQLLLISISEVIVTCMVVMAGLVLIGVKTEIAILLGCIAAATAPAATSDVVEETGKNNKFSRLLLMVVAVDDAWALIIFAVGLAVVIGLGSGAGTTSPLLFALREIGGAVLLGMAIGFPAAYLTGRVRAGEPMLSEALGLVFLCGGLAIWLEVSYLIAAMVMGTVIANCAKHHDYPFHEIKNIEWSFMIVFFVLAGAALELNSLRHMGLIGLVYIFCRCLGKYYGSKIGAFISRADRATGNWLGLALLPQAGANIGMALVAANQFPEYRQMLLSIIISTTVLFELAGPVLTRFALRHADQG